MNLAQKLVAQPCTTLAPIDYDSFHSPWTELFTRAHNTVAENADLVHDWVRHGVAFRQFLARSANLTEAIFENELYRLLSPSELSMAFRALKDRGDFFEMIRLYQSSNNRPFRRSAIIREFYAVALNKYAENLIKQGKANPALLHTAHTVLQESLETSQRLITEGLGNGESYGAAGKALRIFYETAEALLQAPEDTALQIRYRAFFPEDPNLARVADHRERYWNAAFEAYLNGYLVNFEYYPGINAVYLLLWNGRTAEAEKLARMVYASTEMANGKNSRDYWCLATLLELACINRDTSEIRTILPLVLEVAQHDWEIDSTLSNLTKLQNQRNTSGEATAELDKVIHRLQNRSAATEETAAPIAEEPAPHLRLTQAILSKLFYFRGLNADYISGNFKFDDNGIAHDHSINRLDIAIGGGLLERLGLLEEQSCDSMDDLLAMFERFDSLINPLIRKRFETDRMEDIESPFHRNFEELMQRLKAFSGAAISKDSRTSVFADLIFGRADCRPHAGLKNMLFDIWKNLLIQRWMRQAYNALASNDEAGFEAGLEKVRRMNRLQLFVGDETLLVKFQMESKYCPRRGPQGELLPSTVFEEFGGHTLNFLVIFDEDQGIQSMQLRDVFHHHEFDFKTLAVDPENFLSGEMDAGAKQISATESAPLRLRPTAFAGRRDSAHADEYGALWFRGHPLHIDADAAVSLIFGESPDEHIVRFRKRVFSGKAE